jgi:hypothetical protein
MVLQNIIILEPNKPARLHFIDHRVETITITDPSTGGPGIRQRLVFEVDSLNGVAVASKLSTMARGLADKFAGYLPKKTYTDYDFIITQSGTGYQTRYFVEAVPRL